VFHNISEAAFSLFAVTSGCYDVSAIEIVHCDRNALTE